MEQFFENLFGDDVTPNRRIAVFTTPEKRSRLFHTLTELVPYARQRSAAQNIYFGVGLIGGSPPGRGTAADVAAIGALWCDVDVHGPAHPRANLPQSIEEAEALLGRMPLHPSMVVHSGHGLHAYWLLKQPWVFDNPGDRTAAQSLARRWHGRLCHLATTQGWSLENLGDLTRVLRLPGTLNHNAAGEPVAVELVHCEPTCRYESDDFDQYLPPEQDEASPATTGPLVLDPDAEPPAGKLIEVVSQSPAFRKTWNRQRDDLPDQSQSGYDLSLATIAALSGWSDQEVADLIIAARRHHGQRPEKALREDYMRRTLAKAKQAAEQRGLTAGDVDLSAFEPQADRAKSTAYTPSGSSLPEPESVGQLLHKYPQLRPPLIHGLLRRGETMNIISAPKTGKSWLSTDLALAIATGRPWLDTFETGQGDVLLIDNELHAETTANRIPKVARARGVPLEEIADHVFVENMRGRLKDLVNLAPYFMALEPGRFKIVILDAFYRFLPRDTDENDNGAMADLYNCLDLFAARLGCSFVLIHHATKGNQSAKSVTDVGAGAGSQSRATDTHLIMRPHEENDVVVLEAAVRSWPPVDPMCLRWTFPVWTRDDSLDPTALRGERARRKNSEKVKPAKPREPEWDSEIFVESFLHDEPQGFEAIFDMAKRQGLSERKAKRLLRQAEARGHAYRWQFGANRPVGFSTSKQPSLPEQEALP